MKGILSQIGRQVLSSGLLSLSTKPSNTAMFGSLAPGFQRSGIMSSLRNQRRRPGIWQRRRRPGKWPKNNGIEINKAEGGFKNIVNSGIVDTVGINRYYEIIVKKYNNEWSYQIKDNLYSNDNIDITDILNQSDEFKNKLMNSSQYWVKNVMCSFDYTRIPSAGDNLPKLLMFPTMDKISVEDPKIETNVMKLDMSHNGVKNFNFIINNKNTNVLNTGWQDSHYIWNGNCKLNVESQGTINITDESETLQVVVLGVLKITITVLVRLQDSTNQQPRKLMKKEELQGEIEKLNKRLETLEINKNDQGEEKAV
jgi:hypothetical protein